MNTRGLVELIALNVGLNTKILSIELFTVFVLMAILTTLMTSPLLTVFYKRKWDHIHELPNYAMPDFKSEEGAVGNAAPEKLNTFGEEEKGKPLEVIT